MEGVLVELSRVYKGCKKTPHKIGGCGCRFKSTYNAKEHPFIFTATCVYSLLSLVLQILIFYQQADWTQILDKYKNSEYGKGGNRKSENSTQHVSIRSKQNIIFAL